MPHSVMTILTPRSILVPLLPLLGLLPPLAAQQPKFEKITEERLQAAYADARAACEKVLGARLEELPALQIAEVDAIAEVIAAENLPSVRLREPDEDKAAASATVIGAQIAPLVYAKYAWSTRTFLVSPKTWERTARNLLRPQLTADSTLRAVMVHELCHAIDDRKFDFTSRLLEAKTADAITAYSAVMEGHAQLQARRVCAKSGWTDGFEALTSSIGALPNKMLLGGEGQQLLLRAQMAVLTMTYIDGERFAAAVLEARPETGARDIFEAPPKDAETILAPQWYLDPASRPARLYDLEPAIDAFVATFDKDVWSATRSNVTGKQLATGLTMLPKEELDALLASLRGVRAVQLVPTAAPQSKAAILVAVEFDSEDAARRWIAITKRVSEHKDETMDKGILRITGSKTTELAGDPLRGYLQEKQMRNGGLAFGVSSIDVMQGRVALETIFSGDPPEVAAHCKLVEDLLGKVKLKK
ncbi:MAG: hypothetical protein H6838_17780 [Planctomycetes bacterium]|nr:hypothetical protein [Planctomycetota bacterium]MCB9887345.1 hypothetical protein [Planctomycetota bacterium]